MIRLLKLYGVTMARKNLAVAKAARVDREEKLCLYGKEYANTLQFSVLKLQEALAETKYEFYKAVFRL